MRLPTLDRVHHFDTQAIAGIRDAQEIDELYGCRRVGVGVRNSRVARVTVDTAR